MKGREAAWVVEELFLPSVMFGGDALWMIVKHGVSARYSKVEPGLKAMALFKSERPHIDFRLRNTRTGDLVMGAIL